MDGPRGYEFNRCVTSSAATPLEASRSSTLDDKRQWSARRRGRADRAHHAVESGTWNYVIVVVRRRRARPIAAKSAAANLAALKAPAVSALIADPDMRQRDERFADGL